MKKQKAENGGENAAEPAEFEIENGLLIRYNGQGKDVVIPSGVTAIGSDAFDVYMGLTSVVIPEGVVSIADDAFEWCTELENITIPASVTSIGKNAFGNCTHLKNVELCGTASIGEKAFYECLALTQVTVLGAVTSIGESAFAHCGSLKSINLPVGLISIGRWAFSRCYSLKSADLPAGLISIGEEAFKDCGSLERVCIPDSVTKIEDRTFSGCERMKELTVGKGVTEIGAYAFYNCTDLANVYISDLAAWCNIHFRGREANPFYYDDERQSHGGYITLSRYEPNVYYTVIVPEPIRTKTPSMCPPHSLFVNGQEVKELAIPEGVTKIGKHAFTGFSGLTGVTVPGSVNTVGEEAFADCFGLAGIAFSEGLAEIQSEAFRKCTALKKVAFPASVTSIAASAFCDCSALEHAEVAAGSEAFRSEADCVIHRQTNTLVLGCDAGKIPQGIAAIGASAFYGRKGCTGISIPDGVTSIGRSAFRDCGRDNDKDADEKKKEPDELRELKAMLFGEEPSRKEEYFDITIPNSVISIGAGAFYGTPYYNQEANWDPDGVLYIGNYLIGTQEKLSGALMIRMNTRAIADGALKWRTKLTSVTIPESVVTIGSEAFYDCSGLMSLAIPQGVTAIGEGAFTYCHRLTSVAIPDSVTAIGDDAFNQCENLRSVTIPKRFRGFMKQRLKKTFSYSRSRKDEFKKINFKFIK